MKAVILETKDGYCAVLKDDGTVEKIKMTGEVGQEITMPAVRADIRRFPIRRVAAAAVALVAIASGVMSQLQEYSYVSVDVDASVEYSLNRMDRVISVKALNKKGEELAESVRAEGVQGASLDKAVEKTANVLQEQGYVNSDDGVLMSVSSKSEKKSVKLAETVESALVSDDVTTAVEKVSMKDRKNAQDSGLSAGRYAVTKDIVGSEDLDDATIDVVRSKSASDLIQLAEEMDTSDVTDAAEVDGQTTDTKKEKDTKAKDADSAELCEEIEDAQNGAAQAEEEPLAPPLAPLEDTTNNTAPATEPATTTEQVKTEDEVTKAAAPLTDEIDSTQAITEEKQDKENSNSATQSEVKEEQAGTTKSEVKSTEKVTTDSKTESDTTTKANTSTETTTDAEAALTTKSTGKESTSTTNKGTTNTESSTNTKTTTKSKSSTKSTTKSSTKTEKKTTKSE